ncbi:MAG: hypothetical protein K2H20_01630 [Bacilli bacterium]|nr:hypothetical protein [Bacilli bacterium]
MGLFSKIKNILFEEDDEVEEMPVYTKDEVKETPKKIDVEDKPEPIVEEPIKTSSNSRFRNVKRDIDLSFDENDVLGEIPGAGEVMSSKKIEETHEETVVEVKKEEKKSPFLSFDEDEFERLNSRINRNENRVRKEVKSVGLPANTARKANNNFSSTSTTRDTRIENTDRYKLNNSSTVSGKKPFTPSPVISPVYGILDKNYKKDDIVDKQGGMKREKVVKPVIPKEAEITVEQDDVFEVDIDLVRKKAYGELEDYEKNLVKIDTPALKSEKQEVEDVKVVDVPITDIDLEEKVIEEPSIEEQLEDNFDVSSIKPEDLKEETDLDDVVEQVIENKNISEKKKKHQKY